MMKNLILAVFAVILGILWFNVSYADFVTKDGKNVIAVDNEAEIVPVPPEEMKPIYRTPRRGDRLWDYVRQYNLANPQEIVEFNKGKAGEKCIKNENLILRGCEIAIPAYTLAYVRMHDAVNEKVLERAKDVARADGESRLNVSAPLFLFLFFAIALLTVVATITIRALRKHISKAENEKTDLSSKLWAAEDKIKKMEIGKADLENILAYQRSELGEWSKNNQAMANKLNIFAGKASVLPGNYVELQSRENGKIKAKIIKVRLGKNGELEVYVACPAEEYCLVNASENLKLENALSHVHKQHGTSQDLKPNGWAE